MKLTAEMLKKARASKSPEELLSLAKEMGARDVDEAWAKATFDKWNAKGELADEELSAVAGGGCGGEDLGEKKFQIGDHVMAYEGQYREVCGNCRTTEYWEVTSVSVVCGKYKYIIKCPKCGNWKWEYESALRRV